MGNRGEQRDENEGGREVSVSSESETAWLRCDTEAEVQDETAGPSHRADAVPERKRRRHTRVVDVEGVSTAAVGRRDVRRPSDRVVEVDWRQQRRSRRLPPLPGDALVRANAAQARWGGFVVDAPLAEEGGRRTRAGRVLQAQDGNAPLPPDTRCASTIALSKAERETIDTGEALPTAAAETAVLASDWGCVGPDDVSGPTLLARLQRMFATVRQHLTPLHRGYCDDGARYGPAAHVNLLPRPDYLVAVQRNQLQVQTRKLAVLWMFQAAAEMQLRRETVALAISYLDRFLSLEPIRKHCLFHLSAACLLIAGKLMERSPVGSVCGTSVAAILARELGGLPATPAAATAAAPKNRKRARLDSLPASCGQENSPPSDRQRQPTSPLRPLDTRALRCLGTLTPARHALWGRAVLEHTHGKLQPVPEETTPSVTSPDRGVARRCGPRADSPLTQLVQFEHHVLTALQWHLQCPTAYGILHALINLCRHRDGLASSATAAVTIVPPPATDDASPLLSTPKLIHTAASQLVSRAEALIDQCLLEYCMLRYAPDILAAACLVHASHVTGVPRWFMQVHHVLAELAVDTTALTECVEEVGARIAPYAPECAPSADVATTTTTTTGTTANDCDCCRARTDTDVVAAASSHEEITTTTTTTTATTTLRPPPPPTRKHCAYHALWQQYRPMRQRWDNLSFGERLLDALRDPAVPRITPTDITQIRF
ncbi:hypothetical protein CDCA_CDCA18G4574 [Cyanidium caldarium]|uniref:Cyclin-like domain-containing protein n=1 Tax=Cyanidium caldarium TaxID=2771 RepID=A0AAV9J2J8_CYACA|nr:hypothetical protein CDCA_CDCA18G4574 [Cyanidium caldarium]